MVLAVVAGCSFKGAGDPGDDQGDDTGDDQGDDTGVIDAGPGDPDAVPDLPDADLPDPVTTTFGERPTSANGGTLDTHLDSYWPTTVFEAADNIVVDGPPGLSWAATGMLRFDLAPIPSGATIVDVSLEVYTTNNGGGDPVAFYVVNQSWNAAATWETSGIEPWFTAGAEPPSRAEAVVGAIGASTNNTGYTVDIETSVVQSWVDDPDSNRGFALVVEGGSEVYLRGSSSTVPDDRPELTVTYLPPFL